MSSSLWYKAGRSCISPMPTLISVQSVPDEDSAQQQESGYSSLHGYVDYEPRCQSTQARSSFCNTFDSCEGKPSYCLCFETVPLGILFCYKRKWYDSFYFVISRWRWEFAQETFIGKVSVEFWGARGEKDLYEVFLDLNKELKPQTKQKWAVFLFKFSSHFDIFIVEYHFNSRDDYLSGRNHCPGLQNVPFLFLSMAQKHCLLKLSNDQKAAGLPQWWEHM